LTAELFTPPTTATIGKSIHELFQEDEKSDEICITLKTSFSFEDRNVEGHLFLINSKDSIPKLKGALKPFTGM